MEKLKRLFKIKDLRNRIFFILGILVVFQLISNIPIPGINPDNLEKFISNNSDSATSRIISMIGTFTGGALNKFSIVMLGIGPYITASIIMQLLMMIFPKLEEMYKEQGEIGQAKFNQYTRYLTVPLAILNGIGFLSMLKAGQTAGAPIIEDGSFFNYVTMISVIVAGTLFTMWLGELITERGLGNGVSLLIFAGIVGRVPAAVVNLFTNNFDSQNLFVYLVFLAMFLLVIIFVIFITEAQRNISISYAKRIRGSKLYGGTSTYLPLRVNQVGVIPIIFAMSIMSFPLILSGLLSRVEKWNLDEFAVNLRDWTDSKSWWYLVVYFFLVVLFTYFYTSVSFDPRKISENLQKQGGFIPGIRPGDPTTEYLSNISNRILLPGALFLGIIAIMPLLVPHMFPSSTGLGSLYVGGTSLLIVVSVAIETVKQIESQLVIRNYDEI